jgi:hypothetical protein
VIASIAVLIIAADAMYANSSTHGVLGVVAALSTLYPSSQSRFRASTWESRSIATSSSGSRSRLPASWRSRPASDQPRPILPDADLSRQLQVQLERHAQIVATDMASFNQLIQSKGKHRSPGRMDTTRRGGPPAPRRSGSSGIVKPGSRPRSTAPVIAAARGGR